MKFVYLDEFGHIGPYAGRTNRKHNESPVFGLAGIILPEQCVRPFATFFLQQKERIFAADLATAGKMAAKWEKKGSSFIRPDPIGRYPELRRMLMRMINQIRSRGGHVFYYGREKERGKLDGNSIGLYTTCLAHTLRKLDNLCERTRDNYVVVIDQHSARKELLECAAKTMFGRQPCRRLASPPFEVESYLNQNIQAADWIAAIVGRLAAYKVCPEEFRDYASLNSYFSQRICEAAASSEILLRPSRATHSTTTVELTRRDGPFSSLISLKIERSRV